MKTILSWRRFHYLTRVSILLIAVALMAGMADCFGYNPPPPSQNLEIRDWYDLDAIRDNLSGDHILMNDLDSTTPGYNELASPAANGGKGCEPIGIHNLYGDSAYEGFLGAFDGQGYEIRDLFINRPDEGYVGLFGALGGRWDKGAVIKDIGAANIIVIGDYHVGGLVGDNSYSTVSNSYSTGNVTGSEYVGGLVGINSGTVSNSYSTGSVTGNQSVGGLVGGNWGGTVSNSYYNYGEVLINGENVITIGALFGEDFDQWLANDKFLDVDERLSEKKGHYVVDNVSDFKQLLAFGENDNLKFRLVNNLDLVDEPNFYIPYFAGEFDGDGHKISNLNCDFGSVSHVGLFGYIGHGGEVTEVGVENVNITGVRWVGGLVGFNDGAVSTSYSSGSMSGNMYIGGLVGANWGGIVSKSYSTGKVSGDEWVGGLLGENAGGGLIRNSFWDIQTSDQATSYGGTGKTTAEMKDISTFLGADWNIRAVNSHGERDLAGIWNIVDGLTYPFLSWQS